MKLEDVPDEMTLRNGEVVVLTYGERRILKKLYELEKLWAKFGKNLTLFNGDSLFYLRETENRPFCQNDCIENFFGIKGEAGEPDRFPEKN